ncbi:hypothetical protein [Nocardia sp. NPDC049526]|uniref:hypothetical protein n=1 Tax=Nocardia sp. NPDC049526 TaxID=3364316 RepID=UPI0037A02DAB
MLLATALYPVMAAMLVNGPISPIGRDDIDAALSAGKHRCRVLHPPSGRPAEPENGYKPDENGPGIHCRSAAAGGYWG